MSSNYVTKRQSLKLLGEILLDRANFNVMTRYIANEANLKMMMNLLQLGLMPTQQMTQPTHLILMFLNKLLMVFRALLLVLLFLP